MHHVSNILTLGTRPEDSTQTSYKHHASRFLNRGLPYKKASFLTKKTSSPFSRGRGRFSVALANGVGTPMDLLEI